MYINCNKWSQWSWDIV